MQFTVTAFLRDRDGAESGPMARFSAPATGEEAFDTCAFPFGDALQSISDAVLFKLVCTWKGTIDDAPVPSSESDASRFCLFIFQDTEGNCTGMAIPSPREEIYEETGPLAGDKVKQSYVDDLMAVLNSLGVSSPANPGIAATFVAGKGYRLQ